jgi:DNA-binding transcriptional LysR family regulator
VTISVGETARHPLILPDSAADRPSWVEELAEEFAGRRAQFRVESPHLSISLVRAGLGYAVLPRSALLAAQGAAPLSIARIEGVTLERHLATNAARPLSRGASIVIDVVEEEVRRLDASDLFARGDNDIASIRSENGSIA